MQSVFVCILLSSNELTFRELASFGFLKDLVLESIMDFSWTKNSVISGFSEQYLLCSQIWIIILMGIVRSQMLIILLSYLDYYLF